MANHLRHFAIHADDVDRARAFYEAVFAWSFDSWGPPDFYLISTGAGPDRGIGGALQKRQTPLSGDGMRGFECTIGVGSLQRVLELVPVHGGVQLTPPVRIEGVGLLSFIQDSEGNRVGVMQYDDAPV